MDKLVAALGPVFAAGFAAQQLLEFLSPVVSKLKMNKKFVLGGVSVGFGFVLAFGAGLRVLEPMGAATAGVWDAIVTALIISAGTEGINSVMKFLGYAKEARRAAAGQTEEEPIERTAPPSRTEILGEIRRVSN